MHSAIRVPADIHDDLPRREDRPHRDDRPHREDRSHREDRPHRDGGRPRGSVLEVDVATGPGSGAAGLRELIRALDGAGAAFGDLPARYPVEWATLTAAQSDNAAALADLALSASERRLHRESEQTFRVLSVAASAICRGAHGLDRPVLLRGVGRTDLPSLRGLVRVAEYAATMQHTWLRVPAADAVKVWQPGDPAADTRAERARCLQAIGLPVTAEDLQVVPRGPAVRRAGTADGTEQTLFDTATERGEQPWRRVAAALVYGRDAFYASNWEGMAHVAAACLPAAAALSASDLGEVATFVGADRDARHDQAIEFEPALLRSRADVTAYLLKLLGIQASYRGHHDLALRFFRAMRGGDERPSAETVAQSHLYSALTLAKRQNQLGQAAAELEGGFATVPSRPGEPAALRRERGWLHNLRGLILYRQGDFAAALAEERSALECIDGAADPSAVHLRVNLISNISVLQESAGKLEQALQTWLRFRSVGAEADATFVKHHAYRSGGLRIAAGDVRGGIAEVAQSLQQAVAAADDFHEFEISAELGTLLLGRNERGQASSYFEQAALAAARLGDPYRMAVASVGQAAAAGLPIGEHTAAQARASRTQVAQAESLLVGCRDSSDGSDVHHLLPAPRTKLNRPFDLVNV